MYIWNSWYLNNIAKPPKVMETNYSTKSIIFFSPAYRFLRTDKRGNQLLATVKASKYLKSAILWKMRNNLQWLPLVTDWDVGSAYIKCQRLKLMNVYAKWCGNVEAWDAVTRSWDQKHTSVSALSILRLSPPFYLLSTCTKTTSVILHYISFPTVYCESRHIFKMLFMLVF